MGIARQGIVYIAEDVPDETSLPTARRFQGHWESRDPPRLLEDGPGWPTADLAVTWDGLAQTWFSYALAFLEPITPQAMCNRVESPCRDGHLSRLQIRDSSERGQILHVPDWRHGTSVPVRVS